MQQEPCICIQRFLIFVMIICSKNDQDVNKRSVYVVFSKKLASLLMALVLLAGCTAADDSRKLEELPSIKVPEWESIQDQVAEVEDILDKHLNKEDNSEQGAETDIEEVPQTSEKLSQDAEVMLRGTVEEGRYINPYLGLAFTLPDGWGFYTAEDLQASLDALDSLDSQEELDNLKEAYATAIEACAMAAAPFTGMPNVQVTVDKIASMEGISATDETIATLMETQIDVMRAKVESAGYEDYSGKIIDVSIGGKEMKALKSYSKVPDALGGYVTNQLQIMSFSSPYLLIISITASDEPELQEVLSAFSAYQAEQ